MDDPMTRSRLDRVTGTQPIGAPDPKLGPLLFLYRWRPCLPRVLRRAGSFVLCKSLKLSPTSILSSSIAVPLRVKRRINRVQKSSAEADRYETFSALEIS